MPSNAVGGIIALSIFRIVLWLGVAYGITALMLFYDLLLGRAFDSIKEKPDREIYTLDVNRLGWVRYLLLYPLYSSGLLSFWFFSRQRKKWILIIALLISDLIVAGSDSLGSVSRYVLKFLGII